MSYYGWANWETWNVALWLDNDEGLYRASRRETPVDADEAESLVLDLMPNGTPDMDATDDGYGVVDWQEIADAINEG